MAQLRDKRTGELLAEGSEVEVVALADKLGDDVVFDDVGGGFDPGQVREAVEARAALLDDAAKQEKKRDAKADLKDAAAAARAELKPDKPTLDRARKRQREAHVRLEG